ncbi:TPA: hypothetical protein RFY31_004882 [Klebsiella aerogenes]|nr:hypothetical protein [Klebsiella aerogenes]
MVVSFHWHYSPDIGHTYRENVLLTKDKKDFYAHCAQYISYFSIEEKGNGDQYLCYTFDIRTAGRIEGTSGRFFSGEPGDEKLNIDDLTLYEFGDTPVPEME